MGTPLFTVIYDGNKIKTSYLPVSGIKEGARQSLLNFILSYSPEKVLNKILKNSGVTVKFYNKQRLFLYNNKIIIKITYENNNPWKGHVLLENQQDNYSVNIDTISVLNNTNKYKNKNKNKNLNINK